MKRAFVLFILLFQLFAFFTAEAKAPVSSQEKAQKDLSSVSTSFFHPDHPIELTGSTHFNPVMPTIRVSRFLTGLQCITSLAINSLEEQPRQAYADWVQPYVPLVRLLLFPRHYFW